jgi:hypothetical protein
MKRQHPPHISDVLFGPVTATEMEFEKLAFPAAELVAVPIEQKSRGLG